VLVLQSAAHVDVVENSISDSYQLALLSIPTANVQITVDPDNQTDLGAGAGLPIMLTFTPANALIPQFVNVMAVNDMIAEGAHTSVITHTAASSDTRYNGLVISNVVANITDFVPLAGDYNANGQIDAADYVLWRKTLGSTTDLRADGSGPTPGVPNGVVDQADYTFWRSRFGNSSGAGSGVGRGEALSASSVDKVISQFGKAEAQPANALGHVGALSGFLPAGLNDNNLLLALSTAHQTDAAQGRDPWVEVTSPHEDAADDILADLFDGVATRV